MKDLTYYLHTNSMPKDILQHSKKHIGIITCFSRVWEAIHGF